MEDSKSRKRARGDSDEFDVEDDSPEVKRLRENLLDNLDDDAEFSTTSHDLDSFMKSFEEEITASPSVAAAGEAVELVDPSSPGESRPDLGYLLEASDDELGLPPTTSSPVELETEISAELVRVDFDSSDLGSEFWKLQGYDPFEFGFAESGTYNNGGNGEYVALDGLFDYSDMGYGPGDVAWRPESTPALEGVGP